MGVRQGAPLSPTLFKAFINDIVPYVDNEDAPKLNSTSIGSLLYADDIVLLSTSESGLQQAINGLDRYCRDWNLSVNVTKTKVVVFNKKGSTVQTDIKLGSNRIDAVDSYKYLGMMFNSAGNFKMAKTDLLGRGLKSMFKLTTSFKTLKPNYKTCMHLFDMVVKPVMLYGADVCGFKSCKNVYATMKNDAFEKCHIKFCRFALGVNKRAPNIGLYGDTGRFPIYLTAAVHFLKYWYRLQELPEKAWLLKEALACNVSANSQWHKSVQHLLKHIGENSTSVMRKSKSAVLSRLKSTLKMKFRTGWGEELHNDFRTKGFGNKLRSYRNYKSLYCEEAYLTKCISLETRQCIARLRLSAHNLNIETGRYTSGPQRLPPELRICN